MDCAAALALLNERLDAPPAPPAPALADHLAGCADCRAAAEELDQLDALCRRALHESDADRVSAAVLGKLAVVHTAGKPQSVSTGRRWPVSRRWTLLATSLLTAAVLGLALRAGAPRGAPDGPGPDIAADPGPRAPRDAIPMDAPTPATTASVAATTPNPSATLGSADSGAPAPVAAPAGDVADDDAPPASEFAVVLSVGGVEMRPDREASWAPVQEAAAIFTCPRGSEIRTASDGLCELSNPEGCVLRLDADSELKLASSSTVNVARGRLWCKVPEGQSLAIETVSASDDREGADFTTAFTCSSGVMQTNFGSPGDVEVFAASGQIAVATPQGLSQLEAGQVARVSYKTEEASRFEADEFEMTRWMTPLLARRGPDNEEFRVRVLGLTARIGRTKASVLYEEQLLALGEVGAGPLLAFLREDHTSESEAQRHAAARVIRETAGPSALLDLIQLLEDPSPEVRIAAAGALERLTGRNHGAPPESWREPGPAQDAALEAWRAWMTKGQG